MIWLNQHCKACLSNNKLVHLPLPELDLEPSIVALQAAILSGEDPTKIQKATAAGVEDIGSSITDGSLILYDNDQLLATAGFDTAYNSEVRQQDDIPLIIFPPGGGEFYNDIYFVEGDLVPISYPVSDSGSVSVEAATLPLDSNTVAFDSLQIDSLLATMSRELSSNDRPIIFSYDIETNQIIGRSDKGISRSDQGIVLTIGLSAELFNGRDANVIMTVTQFLPLDHFSGESNSAPIMINGEQIRLSLPVEIADINGNLTQVPVNFFAVIEDGKIPQLGTDKGTEFTEQDSDLNTLQSVTGDIPIFIGSDEIGVMTFAEQQPSLIGLLSNDVVTSFSVSGNKVTVIRDDDKSQVLAIEVSTDGQYRVTQYQALNQDNALDQTQLSLFLTTTDRDGDTSNVSELVIKINDGIDPILGIDSGTIITEQDKDIASPQIVTGSIPINVGSDQIKAMVFETQQPTLNGLLSNGKPTVYSIEGNKITLQLADAPQTEVLTIEINTSGEYIVTQYQALNQPIETNIDKLTLGVVAIDTDGDKSNVGELNITIVDGPDPILGKDISTSFTETMSPQTFIGQITVDVGSDDIANATFNLEQTTLNDLTSNGQATSYRIIGNEVELFVPAQGSLPKQPVLSVELENDGRYTIEQSQPLDQNFTTNVNNISLAVTVTDADGDNSNVGQLIINITDG